jgi:hypothetical protein
VGAADVGGTALEIGVEVPDQFAHPLLNGAMQIGGGAQLMHQPFRMYPIQGVLASSIALISAGDGRK